MNVFILWNCKKYVIICLRENKTFFFASIKQNNQTYFVKIAETRCFNYAFLLSDPVEAPIQNRCS